MEAVSREAMEAFLRYLWPGNIRELRNVIEHAFVVGEDSTLMLQDLTPELRGEPPAGESPPAEPSLRHIERERIVAALAQHHGRKAAAAAELGISRSTLWRKLYEHRL